MVRSSLVVFALFSFQPSGIMALARCAYYKRLAGRYENNLTAGDARNGALVLGRMVITF